MAILGTEEHDESLWDEVGFPFCIGEQVFGSGSLYVNLVICL